MFFFFLSLLSSFELGRDTGLKLAAAFSTTFGYSEGALEIRDSPHSFCAFYVLAKRNFSEVVLRAALGRELDFSKGTCLLGWNSLKWDGYSVMVKHTHSVVCMFKSRVCSSWAV